MQMMFLYHAKYLINHIYGFSYTGKQIFRMSFRRDIQENLDPHHLTMP